MRFEIYSMKGGFTAEACDTESAEAYKVTGVGKTISLAVDDALVELGRFKTKCLKLNDSSACI